MVLDLLILNLLAWCVFLGCILGGMRALMYVSALIGTLYILEQMTPLLQWAARNASYEKAFLRWLRWIVSPVAPVLAGHTLPEEAARSHGPVYRTLSALYRQGYAAGYAGAVFVGVLALLRVFETVWSNAVDRVSSRLWGGFLGLSIGFALSGFVVREAGMSLWHFPPAGARIAFYPSLAARVWLYVSTHGIFK